MRSGVGAPAPGLGVDGDFYLDTSANAIYGPRTAGAWGSPVSLVGPQGATGSAGVQGPQGIQGPQGVPGANAVGGYTTVVLGAEVTNSNATANTIADITGLSFPVVSGTTYSFRFVIRYTSAASTTGSRWSINGPAASVLTYRSQYTLAATTVTTINAVAYNIPAASNASSLTAGNLAIIEGIFTPAASGNVIGRFASEIANSAITAKAGSFIEYRVIS